MHLLNLEIEKIAIHQIFQRDINGKKKQPLKSNELINFDENAMETFKQRVINALGSQSKAVNMTIVNQGINDVSTLIPLLCSADDNTFIDLSYNIADKLADAQTKKKLPGGIVVVFKGKIGSKSNRKSLIGIMKAEIHSAYEKVKNQVTNQISLKYVEEALLTPSTKLFKTVGFSEKNNVDDDLNNLNNFWDVFISDSQISRNDGKAAAKYFYDVFLCCGYPESSARQTKIFYDATCGFIDSLDISPEEKNDFRNALVSYLKIENSEVVNAIDFAERYFSVGTHDLYTEYLEDQGLVSTSFTKDNEQIATKLKVRKLSFSNNIKLIAPFDYFKDLVEINTVTEDGEGESVQWTNILVKDRIVTQE
ncbi:nucleoid-associated protein [Photobacterium leiognathi]|uniref:nucleoid-associated protein n=1 Tax=Photobacterium leiognathi TaxID=553611 RepID=UPI0027336758|nr:nucleoid-associated protein [Photobacterium leiognathi]